jgi:hypothetical protein
LKSKLEQLELDYGSIVDLHSRLKNGPPDEVAALVNRIRAEDFPDVRAPLDPGSITSDGYPDEPESSEDVASEANWDSYNSTSPAAYADMSRNPFPQEPFYNRMPDNIPIDPALAGLDPPVNQYTQPSPNNFNPPSMPMPIPSNQDPNINIFGFPISDSGSPVSTRQLFQTQTPSMLRSNLNNLRQGMFLQSRSTPEACSAYSESQVESLISDVQLHADLDIPKSRLSRCCCFAVSSSPPAARSLRILLRSVCPVFQKYCPCKIHPTDHSITHRRGQAFLRRLHASPAAAPSAPQSLRNARPRQHPQQVLHGLCIHW